MWESANLDIWAEAWRQEGEVVMENEVVEMT